MRRLCGVFTAFWLAFFVASVSKPHDAHASKRIALVIGNNSYKHLPANEQLRSAIYDAKGVRAALEGLNFRVFYGENLARDAFEDKLFDFIGPDRAGRHCAVLFCRPRCWHRRR